MTNNIIFITSVSFSDPLHLKIIIGNISVLVEDINLIWLLLKEFVKER